MRDIKFRGKRVDTGEWGYGFYREDIQWDNDDGNRIDKAYIYELSCDGEYYDKIEVISETVGQYTGLKDKNGKDIYEGDIVQGYYGGDKKYHPYVIEFSDGCFVLAETALTVSDWMEFDGVYHAELEIIGNIHDNPELLK